ncbi:MAG: M24 family metallopeptidase, partial [Propionibacteriaceae bacterium]|nr:M24 family metallopeptidase [Propionibacteriaceae bacterium]
MRRLAIGLKSAEDIRAMRVAGLATCRILDALQQAAAPGMTPKELDDIAAEMIRQVGARSSFFGYDGGFGLPPFPAVTCISVNDAVVHGIPDQIPLQDGDLVSIDFGISVQGWHGE